VHPNEKKNPFLSITFTVVARRKGRHQKKKQKNSQAARGATKKKKKNSISSLAQWSGKPRVAPPTTKQTSLLN
jgi:hypothetical protein